MENKYTLGFRFVVAKNGRKRIECQVRCEVTKPLSDINSLILRDYYISYFFRCRQGHQFSKRSDFGRYNPT
jgi:hypothetical protein